LLAACQITSTILFPLCPRKILFSLRIARMYPTACLS
jgi:hypothetical protein